MTIFLDLNGAVLSSLGMLNVEMMQRPLRVRENAVLHQIGFTLEVCIGQERRDARKNRKRFRQLPG